MTPNKTLFVAVSVDADDDGYDRHSSLPGEKVSWTGVEKGIPLLIETLAGYRDSGGCPVKYTWFVRCDAQLKQLYGNEAHLFEQFEPLWAERSIVGDEIAWHPHLYDHDAGLINDNVALSKLLRNSFSAVDKNKYNIRTSRLGRSICNNSLMFVLGELGIRTDSTAMPGKVKKDEFNMIDWSSTPEQPFKPSYNDYRVPGANQTGLLEVPMSMISTQASYDRTPIKRYINLSFKNDLIERALRNFVRENDLLVSIMHPSEVVIKCEHPLLSFEKKDVKRNMDAIMDECLRVDKSVRFITINEVNSLVEKGVINAANN
ncbi:hypothetical protein A2311_06235 [candidate division WOR-1 bacterium RIFOXYB2_FULL_48_7]|uniref:NodB homology domain-containing protein n=1 Tax=candidate division WOR-1 bacterium RIFOXYB2_FULL_48_7 TaxID=1802583 RepID=A0A1F4TVP2_UNCSA|nr:MAG: hypothetical protein A2311_06235 [candidate division WOR-1 bacterium RIFOXYB2_FULL_48_7]